MHNILLLELEDQKLAEQEYWKLPSGTQLKDWNWISRNLAKLRILVETGEHSLEEVNYQLDTVRIKFELNMLGIMDSIEPFKPTASETKVRTDIIRVIKCQPKLPDENDVIILSNAIVFHQNKPTSFVSADSGYKRLNHKQLARELGKKRLISNYPTIELI